MLPLPSAKKTAKEGKWCIIKHTMYCTYITLGTASSTGRRKTENENRR
jgi:hypothetical protein